MGLFCWLWGGRCDYLVFGVVLCCLGLGADLSLTAGGLG